MTDLKAKLALMTSSMKRVQTETKPITDNFLILCTQADLPYLHFLKGKFRGYDPIVCSQGISLLSHLAIYCKAKGCSRIISTNTEILQKLLARAGNEVSNPKLSNYAGSFFRHENLEIVFVPPLAQVQTTNTGTFLLDRYISKLTNPGAWGEATKFEWKLLTERNVGVYYEEFQDAYAIAADIETFKLNLAIRCIGFTGIFLNHDGTISTSSVVLPIDSYWALLWMRKFCALPAQKIFQNGKYDNSYLLRYNSPCKNWLWDTAHLMHSHYAELPKDLAFLNAFWLREVIYWKDLAETNDLFEYYRYNALDTWATANVWIQQMLQMPDWAKNNYRLQFPVTYANLLAEMTGIERDEQRLLESRAKVEAKIQPSLYSLRTSIGQNTFNPRSPKQVLALLHVLGNKDLTDSNEKTLSKAKLRHPLNARLIDHVLDIRGWLKLTSTYLRTNDDADKDGEGGAKEFYGRVLYSINNHGTETSRNASREHHFWCGLQIQNIPTRDGPAVKETIKASNGFYLGECDLEQAESRDTAHIAGDERLIAAVSGSRDFHSVNASAFFGIPYCDIYDDAIGKTKDKKLRDLAKRVNHGANYNMGPGVLIETMGLDKIWEAKKLLNLPYSNPKHIAEYLLEVFHKTYPYIKGKYYVSVINEVGTTHKLVSRAYHHTKFNLSRWTPEEYIETGDWTRYCFGDPSRNKSDLNAYVAHCPQSLNARTLNEAFMEVFYHVALPNAEHFRLHAQIHDSILFSYREGHEQLADKVRELMEIPVTVRDVSGTYRTFTVPAALKLGKKDSERNFKRATYWSETE